MQISKTRKIVTLAMLTAICYLLALLIRISIIPSADFLDFSPSDVPVAIAAFLFGPLASVLVAVAEAFLEGITFSTTGLIGAVMNAVSTASYAAVAGLVYQKQKNIRGAITGLIVGTLLMTGMMLLWNYWLTPIYRGIPRDAVASMLPTVFLPFNLIKGGINSVLTFLVYKPVSRFVKQSHQTV
ncbi:MAG TPA: ECF transporter S component [Firmicutes bacterium]|nr:ECF transporter S component [Bacillota bacterium]